MKKILIVNPGSTSTKYKLFTEQGKVISDHNFEITEVKEEKEFLSSIEDLTKVGIRVVHGGDLSDTSKINKRIKDKIKEYTAFAPIHNALATKTIEKMEKIFPNAKLYANFDTAFHTTIPEENATYAIPLKLAKKYKLRKYGFHGLAVSSALKVFKKELKESGKKLPKNIVFAHLGGGASITAVKGGKSFATTMGLTPLSGIMMVTRAGDIDPDLNKILALKEGKTIDEISYMLNNESGFYGMTGTKDSLKIFKAAEAGSKKEKLAFDIFVNNIVEKIYGFAGLMGGIDAVVFSGGIGYNDKFLRNTVTKRLKTLGLTTKDIYRANIDEEQIMFDNIKKMK